MNVKIDHINLTVSHLESSVNWYEKVFGFELVQDGVYGEIKIRWAIVAHKDSMICMHELKERRKAAENKKENFHQIQHFRIRVFNLKIWKKKIKNSKLKPVIVKYPYSISYYVDDPDGHEIEVSWTKNSTLHFPPIKNSILKDRKFYKHHYYQSPFSL